MATEQNPPVRVRPATQADLDELCRLRLAFVADVRGVDASAFAPSFVEGTRAFFVDTMQRDRIRSWLAVEPGEAGPIGIVSVLLTDVPPLPERERANEGHIVNMYVVPSARRAGVARALLDTALAAGPALGLRGFFLHATVQGRPLYERIGFEDDARVMVLPVDP